MAPELFTRLPDTHQDTVQITFNNVQKQVPAGLTVAAALLTSGETRFRVSPVSRSPRAPYCMMGVCFECLVEIDGVANRQSCVIPVRDGMIVRSQEHAAHLDITQEPSHG